MLIDYKDYVARNGKIVFHVFNRKLMTNESVISYFYEWVKANKDVDILMDEITNELSSPIKFPFVGILYSQKQKKWLISNWTISGKYDTDMSPNDLVRMKG